MSSNLGDDKNFIDAVLNDDFDDPNDFKDLPSHIKQFIESPIDKLTLGIVIAILFVFIMTAWFITAEDYYGQQEKTEVQNEKILQ
jgi:hypothetical protein